ncbi:hypothetical protein BDY21DRAFT_368673 [Lineolata rhizophorae]|uniref:Extracellular membrane protein CFEM domain-containing protein n=1 Tax=Lineolata rhizophorae TaxID=578093 RepID=A0A6A6PBW2_9PEZI|nr:hypothetical protein BDY21DRAFT_368673 [Lineolata rhizophorae]
MRFQITAAILASAGIAAAQTTASTPAQPTSGSSSGSSDCEAQNIVDSCLATTQIQVDGCDANDWQCLCDAYEQVVTCWNNCPNSDQAFGDEQTKTSYCNAAEAQNPSSDTTTAAAAATTGATTGGASSAAATGSAAANSASSAIGTPTGDSSSDSTATGSAASASSSGAAGGVYVPAGGFVAAVVGLAGML